MTGYFLPLLLFFILTGAGLSVPAAADEGYYNSVPAAHQDSGAGEGAVPALRTVTVTSIEKCYAQLGRADALDIQKNYLKPYEECQRRLALKVKKEQAAKAGEVKNSPAGSAPHFYRVQGKTGKSSGKSGEATPSDPPVFEQKTVPLK